MMILRRLFRPGSLPSAVMPVETTVDLVAALRQVQVPTVLRAKVVSTNQQSRGSRYGWGLDCVVLRRE